VISRDELHRLIDALDDDIIVPALHALVETLPEQAVPSALTRLRAAHERDAAMRQSF
jgi:hypothetical protein